MRPKALETFLTSVFQAKLPVCIAGAPGIGKTAIIQNVVENILGWDFVLMHPGISSPIDFKGLGIKVSNTEARFVPFGDLFRLVEAKKPTVCLMDDLAHATQATQAALMQLIWARRLDGHIVSDQVVFCSATNRIQDMSGVHAVIEAFKSRNASIVTLEPSVEDWVRGWALHNKIHEDIIAFVRLDHAKLYDFKPTKDLTNSVCPRTVENASRLLSLEMPIEIEKEAVGGAVGQGWATEFYEFRRLRGELPTWQEIKDKPKTAIVPKESSPDACFLVSSIIASNGKATDSAPIATYMERLGKEYQALIFSDMLAVDPKIGLTKEWRKWRQDNANLMAYEVGAQ